MGKALDAYLAEFGDPTAPSEAGGTDAYFSPDLSKRLRTRMLEEDWKKRKGSDGKGFTEGQRAFIDAEGQGNVGAEDLRQHRELFEFLRVKGEDVDKALESTGSYKLEKTPDAAKEWGIPKMIGEELSRAGGIVAKPFKELFKGNPLNALKEAALIPAETLTGIGDERDLLDTQKGVLKEGAGRLLGAAREGVQGIQNKVFVKPGEALQEGAGAFWKQLTEGGDEQQKKQAETFRLNKQAGENALISEHSNKYKYLPNYSTVLGLAADPLNYVGLGLMGKAGKLLGIKATRLGLSHPVVDSVGKTLATTFGTQAEKWTAQRGAQAGGAIYDDLVQQGVKAAMGKEQLAIDVAKNFSEPKVFDFLKSVPFIGESGAKSITNTLRALPLVGKKFGVTSADHPNIVKSIEGIKELDPSGNLVFGTETRTGSGVARVAAPDAQAAFNALSPSGQRAVKWFVDYRAQQKAALGILSDIEGYFPHVWEEGLFGAGKGKFALTQQKAKGLMERAIQEGTGYTQNPEKAILSRYGEIIGKEAHNDAATSILANVADPIPASGIPEGFVQIPALKATRTGRALTQMGGGKMIRKDLYDELIRYTEGAKSVGGVQGAVQKFGNFFKSNLLLAPGTVVTNALGGGAQLAGKIMENLAGVVTGKGVKPLVDDITSLIVALKPGNVEKLRPELWGGKSALFSELGKASNPLTKLIQAGLAPFGAVENYFKRVIALSELGAKGLKGLTKEQIAANKGLLGELNKTIDTYAFNYDNVPKALKNLRESPWGWAVVPFPTYGYKLGRYYSRYFAALNPFVQMEVADRAARLLTLTTLGGAGLAAAPGRDRKHIEGMTSQVDTTGRSKIGTTPEGKESWLRTIKYPWANLGHVLRGGADLLSTGDSESIEGNMGEFLAEGPLVDGLKVAANIGNRWETYIPRGVRAGNIVAGMIPGTRLTQGFKAMEGGERTLPTDFKESVLNAIPFTGMRGKIQKDRITRKPVILDANIETLKFWLGLSMKEINPKRYNVERQKKLRSAVVAIGDAKDSSELNKAVDRLRDVDPERLDKLADMVKGKQIRLEGQAGAAMQAAFERDREKMSEFIKSRSR